MTPFDKQAHYVGEHLLNTCSHNRKMYEHERKYKRTNKTILGVGYVLNTITLFVEHHLKLIADKSVSLQGRLAYSNYPRSTVKESQPKIFIPPRIRQEGIMRFGKQFVSQSVSERRGPRLLLGKLKRITLALLCIDLNN